MTKLDSKYNEIIHHKGFDITKLNLLGEFIDESDDLKSKTHIILAKDYLEENKNEFKTNNDKCLCHYFLGVSYSSLRHYDRENIQKIWEWDNRNIDREIINLRLAERYYNESELQIERYCQILTNLANVFDYVGRYIESMKYWNKVIEIDPRFGMALTNKGNSLVYHGLNTVMFEQDKIFFIQSGYNYLKKGVNLNVEAYALPDYLKKIESLENNYFQIINYVIKVSKPASFENQYHEDLMLWCFDNRLLLNPYMDVGKYEFAFYDDVTIPAEFKKEIPLFEQINVEFKMARELFYKSKYLINMSDLERNENLKLSFRTSYSIFDKIAYLLNSIYNLQVPYYKTSFRRLWYKNQKKNKGIIEHFVWNNNLLLRGLFYISKELFLENDEHFDSIEPDAKEIDKIRNYIEHKCFQIDVPKTNDQFSYEIDKEDFEAKTLRLLLLVRESIMYIPYSINRELKFDKNAFNSKKQ